MIAFNNPPGNPPTDGGTIGVGINAPANSIYVKSDGNVGISTTGPGYKLDVQNGQINVSGGLCIAGDCKTAWSQVGGGASYWTLSGSSLYASSTSYNVSVGTVSPDSNYKITTSGGGIKAESTSQPAGYFSSASGYGLIVNSGNVGIGTTDPGSYKLDVVGGKFRAAANVYDSGWFPVTVDTTYTKIHNLNTTKVLISLMFSPNSDGSGFMTVFPDIKHYDAANTNKGGGVVSLNTTQVQIRYIHSFFRGRDANGVEVSYSSGYMRIIMLALE